MFVVFGANGNTGHVVATTLLERGAQVRAVARDLAKLEDLRALGAEVVSADVLDPASVAAALRGATGAYLMVPPDLASDDLVGRGRRIVEGFVAALRQTTVAHAVVLSSVAAQQPSGTGPIVITHHAERALQEVPGTRFSFLRAAYFMENLLASVHPMKADGVLPVFGGGEEVRFPMVATRDIGRVAAETLLAPPAATQWIQLAGPEDYSMADAAAIAARRLGRAVTAVAAPIDVMVPTLTSFGISANVAGLYREMTEGLGKGLVTFDPAIPLRRGTVTLDSLLSPALA